MPINLLLVSHTVALVFLVILVDVCLFSLLPVKLFSEDWAWRGSCWVADRFWRYMQHHWEVTLHAEETLKIEGDPIPFREPAVVISNHLSYSDFYLLQAISSRAGMLGNSRFFAKKEIVWQVPFFGPAFYALGMILVSRKWANDARLIEQAFSRIKLNKPEIWVVLYPEGTRWTEKKLLQAQAFGRERSRTELQHLLLPRTKGFVATIQGLRDSHIKYLYDLTFLYTCPPPNRFAVPSLADQLSCPNLSKAGYGFRIHVRRIPIADLPEDEEGLREWCESCWVEKDKRLEAMISETVKA